MNVSPTLAELCEGAVLGDEPPAHPHRVGLGFQQSAFELGVVEISNAFRGFAKRHRLVSLAYEHRAALGVGMKSDCRYAAPILGIEFAYRPNQAYSGLTPVDHRNSTWKPDILERVGVKHRDSLCSAAVTEHSNRNMRVRTRLLTGRRRAHRRRGYRVRLLVLSGEFGIPL